MGNDNPRNWPREIDQRRPPGPGAGLRQGTTQLIGVYTIYQAQPSENQNYSRSWKEALVVFKGGVIVAAEPSREI